MDNLHLLENNWTLWFHNINNNDWSINSYNKVYSFNNIETFIMLFRKINNFSAGMFFLMKEGIQPLWEHESNINGGCWSYKISKKECYISWVELLISICGENLLEAKYNNIINGVSISPKKNFCIVKIWLGDCNNQNPQDITYFTGIDAQGCLFKKHLPEY